MTDIGANNYAADTLLADATWCADIANSAYIENVLNVKIPTMTSNTTPSGEASASSIQSGFPAWYAFSDSFLSNSGWIPNSGDPYNTANVAYEFESAKKMKAAKMVYHDASNRIQIVKIQALSNSNTWEDLADNVTLSTTIIKTALTKEASEQKYTKFRLLVYASGGTAVEPANGHGYSLQLYGREDV